MADETIQIERRGTARVITLDRPERRNAVSLQMMRELTAALLDAEGDSDLRSVILTGGPVFFSAGRDLKEADAQGGASGHAQAMAALRRLTDTIETLKVPVVASIEGHCLTGGLELALACDLRVAGEGASFGITSARLGTIPGFGGTQRLPRVVGVSRALELLFSADPIGVEEAYRIGLINRRAARGEALAGALALVEVFSDRAPLSLAALKRVVRQGMEMEFAAALDLEQEVGATLIGTADQREGMIAFQEKRGPRFSGR